MLHNDRDALLNMIAEVGTEPGIQRIRILNKDGLIIYSTAPKEVGTPVDKSAEGCIGCHAQSAPLSKLTLRDRTRYFTDKQGHRMLAVMREIENSRECSNGPCHGKEAGRSAGSHRSHSFPGHGRQADPGPSRALTWFLVGAMLFGSGRRSCSCGWWSTARYRS